MLIMSERLFRSRDDRMLAGVAGGLAELWDADPSLVRILWALLVLLTGGLALVVYIVMAIVVPEGDPAPREADPAAIAARDEARAARRAERAAARARGGGSAPIVFGGILIAVGAYFLALMWWPQLSWEWFWPVLVIGIGVILVLTALGRQPRADAGAATADPRAADPTTEVRP
jgi:phage shock protein C